MVDALHGADEYLPSPDLFAKVRRSIEEDAAHRRRVRRALSWAGGGFAAAVAWVAAFLDLGDGTATMPWWALEILTVAILVAVVVVLGPLIRRFGAELTREVFRSNRVTSRHFLALLDIAYYLVFTAFILMTTSFSAQTEWGGRLAAQLEDEVLRIAERIALTPTDLQQFNKRAVHRQMDAMGIRAGIRAGTEMQTLAFFSDTTQAYFKEMQKGLTHALSKRDEAFGDYRTANEDHKGGDNNEG